MVNDISSADFLDFLSPGDKKTINEATVFLRLGLPDGTDLQNRSWLSRSLQFQLDLSNLSARIANVQNATFREVSRRRAQLSPQREYSDFRSKEALHDAMLERDVQYRDAVTYRDSLEVVRDFVTEMSWLFRKMTDKVPWGTPLKTP